MGDATGAPDRVVATWTAWSSSEAIRVFVLFDNGLQRGLLASAFEAEGQRSLIREVLFVAGASGIPLDLERFALHQGCIRREHQFYRRSSYRDLPLAITSFQSVDVAAAFDS